MNRTRTLLAACALALPLPIAVAGCGGDDTSDRDPQEVLEATFNNDERITSGVLDMSIEANAEGEQGGNFTASVSGPFQGDPEDPNAVPQLDLTASVSGEGSGQSIEFEGGVVVTEDNAFVEYGGEAYEVGEETFAQFRQQAEAQAGGGNGEDAQGAAASFREGCERAIEAQGGDPAACDFDVSAWFTDLTNEGTEDVGGAEATHVAGNLDVQQMLSDLLELGTSVPQAQQQGVSPEMIQGQLDQVAEAVEEANFDVYSATEDDTLRGLDFTIAVDPTAIEGGEAAGVDSLDLSFSLELSDVGSDQEIEAPSDPRPLEELTGDVGLPIPGAEIPGLTPGGGGIPGGSGGGGGQGADAQEAQDAAECLSQAQTDAEIEACFGL